MTDNFSERFQELRNKGWKNLSKEEKAEYQSLKPSELQEAPVDPPVPTPAPTPSSSPSPEETVEVRKSLLEGLFARLERLEASENSNQKKSGLFQAGTFDEDPEKPRIYGGTLRRYREVKDGKETFWLAIDLLYWKDSWNELTQSWDQVYEVTLRKTGGEIKKEYFPLVKFVNEFEREEVTILERKIHNKYTVTNEMVTKREVDDEYAIKKGPKVPVRITFHKNSCRIKLQSGEEIELPEDCLNR